VPKRIEASNAVAAALTRLVADGFVVRFLVESAFWHFDEGIITQTLLLRQLKMLLDELILAAAGRLKALGQ
jgi:hypothetical protein